MIGISCLSHSHILASSHIIQRRILSGKRSIPEPDILPKSSLIIITYLKKSASKEISPFQKGESEGLDTT
jgi:hypothetical protein